MSSAAHLTPSGDCVFCCEDLTSENFVEYRARDNGPWLRSLYCQDCIESQFIAKQWSSYLDKIAKADCAAALKRVLSDKPPINVKDAGLPCGDDSPHNGEVESFYFHRDAQIHSAKLVGSLEGAERDAFYADKLSFLTATEIEEEKAKMVASKGKEAEVAAQSLER